MNGRTFASAAKSSAPIAMSKWSTRFTFRPKRSMRVTCVPRAFSVDVRTAPELSSEYVPLRLKRSGSGLSRPRRSAVPSARNFALVLPPSSPTEPEPFRSQSSNAPPTLNTSLIFPKAFPPRTLSPRTWRSCGRFAPSEFA